MLLPPVWPVKLAPRADFKVDEFRRQIYALGWRLTWRQAEACPCKEAEDHDSGRMGCPVCGGRGWAWHSPQEIRAIVTKAQQTVDPYNATARAEWGSGSLNLTLLPEHLPSRFDRFEALDAVFLMREISVRSSEAPSRLRYPVARRALVLSTGPVTVGVLRMRSEAADGTAAVQPLVEGTHFEVTNDGDVDWTLGDALGVAPAVGRRFAATYYAHPVFEAIEDAYSARDTRSEQKAASEYHVPMVVQTRAQLVYGRVRL